MKNNELYDMCEQIIELNKVKYRLIESEIEKIINNKIKDEKNIEKTLDSMLDVLLFYETEETLLSFKKLCSYYFEINPEVTAEYIYLYKSQSNDDENLSEISKSKKIEVTS